MSLHFSLVFCQTVILEDPLSPVGCSGGEREREVPFIVLASSLQNQFCKAMGVPYLTEARQKKGGGGQRLAILTRSQIAFGIR